MPAWPDCGCGSCPRDLPAADGPGPGGGTAALASSGECSQCPGRGACVRAAWLGQRRGCRGCDDAGQPGAWTPRGRRLGAGVWPGPACGYWNMRAQGRHALAWIPRAVAVGALRFSVAAADLRCDWFRMARAGLRFQVQATAVGQQPLSRHAGMALAELSAADDAGHSYRLRWDGGRGSDRLWVGEVVAEPMSEHERPDDVAWFELATVDGPAARVVFAPPPAIPVGPAAPPWPTPAESYLAWLSRQDPAPELGRSGGREVVAAVAEGLVSVGAMPAHSPLLAADPGQAQALIAPGPAAYVAASCPPGHTARSADRAVRCPAVRARSCGDRGLVGVGRRHPATHLRLAVGPGPALADRDSLLQGPRHR